MQNPIKQLVAPLLCVLLFCAPAARAWQASSTPDRETEAKALADQALQTARSGHSVDALAQYRRALSLAPTNVAILRDYAVVLGWAEQYKEAISAIEKLLSLEREQPQWALREFSRSYLFGGAPESALRMLNQLVADGDTSETVLIRRGLALRWLGRPKEASAAYQQAIRLYPQSGAAYAGLIYSLGSQERLPEALLAADDGLRAIPGDTTILKAKARILNWMGRHREAQALISRLPEGVAADREAREDRIAAARWGGDPTTAARESALLAAAYPSNPTVQRLSKEVRLEYGSMISPGVRYISDSDGFIDRTASGDFEFHLSPAHLFHGGYQHRSFTQEASQSWSRYELGWVGILKRRFTVYTTLADVQYLGPRPANRIIGDASVTFAANDRLRLSGGGGSIAMDAFRAVVNRVTAPFLFGDLQFTPDHLTKLQLRYSHYAFSDGVTRDRADFEGTRRVFTSSLGRLSLGWRSNLLWHDAYTEDFYSPSYLQSHLALLQSTGRITRNLDYWVEVAGGWQSEPNTPWQRPLQISGRLLWTPSENWRAVLELGRTSSSVDRVTASRSPYVRRFASARLEYRF